MSLILLSIALAGDDHDAVFAELQKQLEDEAAEVEDEPVEPVPVEEPAETEAEEPEPDDE